MGFWGWRGVSTARYLSVGFATMWAGGEVWGQTISMNLRGVVAHEETTWNGMCWDNGMQRDGDLTRITDGVGQTIARTKADSLRE